ncbi:MAG: YdcF family protein, partial [Desulfobacterales bacterium]|nr:YdcF family protein [Desulfobacterales bacterium]
EAIVVFRGTQKRVEIGYALAASGMAPKLILTPATDAVRNRYDRRFGLPAGVKHLKEPAARTTFENAYYTAQVIRAGNLRSVTLVTSNYHMPRSLLLLRLFLAGKGVSVAGHKVSGVKEGARPPDGYRATFAKLVYNEMLKFWGSLAEYIAWQISGDEMERFRDRFPSISALRSLLLLDVSPSW